MYRRYVLPLCLGLATLLAWRASQPPRPLPASAPPQEFAAGRALAAIAILARAPHPLGSAAHDDAAAYVLARMRALQLEPRVQQAIVRGHLVRNLIGVLPGRMPSAPAVALMAHYDTAPGSPGAADDSTGVAVALEIARALRAGAQPERDVALVITDGEEVDLLGARAFYDGDPLARRVGLVLNMEARGSGGRVFMFETSPDSGALVDVYRRVTPHPSSNSLAVFVYRHMPNDTDFTVVRQHGGVGLNYAFIGRQVDYHAPTATLARLEAGSVQHMGEQVLAATRAFAFADALPPRRADRVHADVLGIGVLAYAPAVGWGIVVAAGLLLLDAARRLQRAQRLRKRALASGALAGLLVLPAAAGLALAVRHLTGVAYGFETQRPLLAAFGTYELAVGLAALGAALLLAAWPKLADWGAWLGALLPAWLASVAVQAWEPLIAFLTGWPLLIASATLWLSCLRRRDPGPGPGGVVIAAGAVVALAQCLYLGHAVMLGVGARWPIVAGLFAWLGCCSCWPLLQATGTRRSGALAGLIAIALAALLAATFRLH
jgi:hypothetical protein